MANGGGDDDNAGRVCLLCSFFRLFWRMGQVAAAAMCACVCARAQYVMRLNLAQLSLKLENQIE